MVFKRKNAEKKEIDEQEVCSVCQTPLVDGKCPLGCDEEVASYPEEPEEEEPIEEFQTAESMAEGMGDIDIDKLLFDEEPLEEQPEPVEEPGEEIIEEELVEEPTEEEPLETTDETEDLIEGLLDEEQMSIPEEEMVREEEVAEEIPVELPKPKKKPKKESLSRELPVETPEPVTSSICPRCGYVFNEEDGICFHCGLKLADTKLARLAQDTEKAVELPILALINADAETVTGTPVIRQDKDKYEIISCGTIKANVINCTEEEGKLLRIDHTLKTADLPVLQKAQAIKEEVDNKEAVEEYFGTTVTDLNNISSRELSDYLAVEEGLYSGFAEMNLSLEAAAVLAEIPEETQKRIAAILKDTDADGITLRAATELKTTPNPTDLEIARVIRQDIRESVNEQLQKAVQNALKGSMEDIIKQALAEQK